MAQTEPLTLLSREDREYQESDRSRRLSLQPKDLPVSHYFRRVGCCDCCKSNKNDDKQNEQNLAYEAYLDDEYSEEKRQIEDYQNKKAKKVLISEQCLDETINKIVNNLSWVNATLLAVAMKNTIEIEFPNVSEDRESANNAWIYFWIMFTIGIVFAVLPRAFEDEKEVLRELELKEALEDEENKRQDEGQQDVDDDEWSRAKLYEFVEVEANDLVEKFEDLFIPTLSNCVSMAWRDAAKATFVLMLNTASATATAYFFYALFMTTFGIYLMIRIGQVYEAKEVAIYEYLAMLKSDGHLQSPSQVKKKLLAFAFVQRSIKLTQSIVKFAIAWSWRDCIKAFMYAVYGESSSNIVLHQWGYFITLALFVSVLFAFSEQFYILYPKNATPEEQQAFLNDKSRKLVNEVLYDNFLFVAGMALFDALMTSLESLSDSDEISHGVLCLFYWLVAIGGICTSVIGTHYVTKWNLRNKIAEKGPTQALFDTFERFYDPECRLHIEGDADFVPLILDTTVYELVYVTVSGLGIAGSMGTTNAIKFTINLITYSSGFYDAQNPDTVSGNVGLIWISFGICLAISTLLTAYLVRVIQLAKSARRSLFKRFRDDDEMKEERMEEAVEEVLEVSHEIQQDDYDKTKKSRRPQASTKAADNYIDDSGPMFTDASTTDAADDTAGVDVGGDDAGDAGDSGAVEAQ